MRIIIAMGFVWLIVFPALAQENGILFESAALEKKEAETKTPLPENATQGSPESDSQKERAQVKEQMETLLSYQKDLEAKQKEIDLLALELQKTDLVLKRKELQKKISEIELSEDSRQISDNKKDTAAAGDFKVSLVFITPQSKEAVLERAGEKIRVREGESIYNNIFVKEITGDGVLLAIEGSSRKIPYVSK